MTAVGRAADPFGARTVVSALAVLLTAAAFSGVFSDPRWVAPVVLMVGAVAAVGWAGRRWRWWQALTILAQLATMLLVLIVLFSGKGWDGLLPDSGSLTALQKVLSRAVNVVQDGVPPVAAEPSLQCLASLGLGVIAVLVDVVVVTAATPAAAGLLLLCEFAVPASLARTLLPWWAFVASAAGFTLLLASGGAHSAAEQLRRAPSSDVRRALVRQASALMGVAIIAALLTGMVFTGVGTEGRLPGGDDIGFASTTDTIGLRPFASLRGQLTRETPAELFRIRGLPQSAYLRVMTLRKFDPQRGWVIDGLTPGVPAQGPLQPPPGAGPPDGIPLTVQIDPVGYRDPWLPLFGIPLQLSGVGPNWRYDATAGMVFTQSRQQARPYTERLVLPTPDPAKLREATGATDVDPAYLDTSGVPQQIKDLAQRITTKSTTPFDQAVALNEYFTDPANGFTYDLQTAPPSSSDALSDFLFRGKRGYCEQFASAMAVLLREIGIPSRVAIGFTSGYVQGDQRVITTNDAHAWVEAYLPGAGWTTFDPTPLGDGRAALPSYLEPQHPPQQADRGPDQIPVAPTPRPLAGQPPPAPRGPAGATARPGGQPGGGSPLWPVTGVSVLAAALIVATPAGLRELRRRQRLQAIAEGGTNAASTAWREVLDEFRDRGSQVQPTETVRSTASQFADQHGLDADGTRALHDLVGAVEREWYAPAGTQAPEPVPHESLRQIVASLRHATPLCWRQRLLPRSVLRRLRG